MKRLEVRLKYSAARSIFNSPLGTRVSSDVETLRLMPPGGIQQMFKRGGSSPRSKLLPFYVPFSRKRYPFRIPSIDK